MGRERERERGSHLVKVFFLFFSPASIQRELHKYAQSCKQLQDDRNIMMIVHHFFFFNIFIGIVIFTKFGIIAIILITSIELGNFFLFFFYNQNKKEERKKRENVGILGIPPIHISLVSIILQVCETSSSGYIQNFHRSVFKPPKASSSLSLAPPRTQPLHD